MKIINYLKTLLTFCIVLLIIQTTSANSYYFSISGKDDWQGTTIISPDYAGNSKYPFKTISKLNDMMTSKVIVAGDKIFFKKGETFRGQLNMQVSGTSTAHIYYGSWSTGATPVLSGAVRVGDEATNDKGIWELHDSAKGIWRCYYKTAKISQLFVDNVRQQISRYPNINSSSPYLYADAGSTINTIKDAQLGITDPAKLAGSTVAVRFIHDAWANVNFSSLSNGTITLSDNVSSNSNWKVSQGSGYYLYGNYSMLDAEGEWYYDPAGFYLYYIPATGINPNDLVIEGSTNDFCINTNGYDHFDINGLELTKASNSGINMANTSDAELSYLKINNCVRNGIFFNNWSDSYTSARDTIRSCTINDCQIGILAWRTTYAKIYNNTINNIGNKLKGYKVTFSDAICSTSKSGNNDIYQNTISLTGKSGIRTDDHDNKIYYNLISKTGQATADLAGIYLGGSTKTCINNNVHHNFVFDTESDTQTWENDTESYLGLSMGLYTDIWSKNNIWADNTVYNSQSGAESLNEINGTWDNNIFFDYKWFGMIFIERPNLPDVPEVKGFATGNVLKNNIFHRKNTLQYSKTKVYWFENTSTDWWSFFAAGGAGTNSNYYLDPINKSGNYIGQYKYYDATQSKDVFPLLTFSSSNGNDNWLYKLSAGETNSKFLLNPPFYTSTVFVLFMNKSGSSKTVANLTGTWLNPDGSTYTGTSVTLAPYSSKVLGKGTASEYTNVNVADVYSSRKKESLEFTLNTTTENSFMVYPNPVESQFVHIRLDPQVVSAGSCQIEISDLSGKRIFSKNYILLSQSEISIQLDTKPVTGIYLLNVRNGNYLKSQKLLIK